MIIFIFIFILPSVLYFIVMQQDRTLLSDEAWEGLKKLTPNAVPSLVPLEKE